MMSCLLEGVEKGYLSGFLVLTLYDVLSIEGGREMIYQWFPGFDTV